MTKIELELTESGQRWECTVCGSFERGYRARSGCGEFSVCEVCIKAEDIDGRLQRHADWVRGLIGKLKVPTFADLQRFQAEEAQLQASQRPWEVRCLEETEPEGPPPSWSTLCAVLNTPAAEITAPEVGA